MWFFPRCLSESLSPVCIHLISHISICYTANTWAAATILMKFIYNLFRCCCFTGCRPFLRSRRRKNDIHPKLERYLNSCTSTLMVEVQWAKRFHQIAQRVWEWDRETTSEIHTHTKPYVYGHTVVYAIVVHFLFTDHLVCMPMVVCCCLLWKSFNHVIEWVNESRIISTLLLVMQFWFGVYLTSYLHISFVSPVGLYFRSAI